MYRLATTKRTGKKRVEENANVSFLRRRKPHMRWFIGALITVENFKRSTSRTLFVTLEWNAFG